MRSSIVVVSNNTSSSRRSTLVRPPTFSPRTTSVLPPLRIETLNDTTSPLAMVWSTEVSIAATVAEPGITTRPA